MDLIYSFVNKVADWMYKYNSRLVKRNENILLYSDLLSKAIVYYKNEMTEEKFFHNILNDEYILFMKILENIRNKGKCEELLKSILEKKGYYNDIKPYKHVCSKPSRTSIKMEYTGLQASIAFHTKENVKKVEKPRQKYIKYKSNSIKDINTFISSIHERHSYTVIEKNGCWIVKVYDK